MGCVYSHDQLKKKFGPLCIFETSEARHELGTQIHKLMICKCSILQSFVTAVLSVVGIPVR